MLFSSLRKRGFQWKGGRQFGEWGLRSRRPGTRPQDGNARKVLAGVLAQVLAKTGVLARVLAQVLAGCFVSVFPNGPTCQHLCQHSAQHTHFGQHLCQHPRQHFSGIPILGSCTRSLGSQNEGFGKAFYREGRQFSEEVPAIQWTAGLWKLKSCCPHPLPENQLLHYQPEKKSQRILVGAGQLPR